MDLIGFILVVLFTVSFHELGHFLVARWFKMRVLEFSVGMGKPLFTRTDKYGTVWQLALIPIGGYVRLDERNGYENHPVYQRFLMVLAGPVFSILLGWILFFALFFVWGKPVLPDYKTTGIYEILPDTPASQTDLQQGDVIIQIAQGDDIRPIDTVYDMYMAVQHFKSQPLTITVQRQNTQYKTVLTPRAYKTNSGDIVYRIGVKGFPVTTEKMSIPQVLVSTNSVTWRTMTIIYDAIVRMFLGDIKKEELGGPVKIASMAGDSLQMGLRQFIIFLGAFSINLGLFNLIPLPVLDGGRLVLLCAEGIMRKPLSTRISHMLITGSMAVVLSFLIFVTLIDIGIL